MSAVATPRDSGNTSNGRHAGRLDEQLALIDVRAVAEQLGCSTRHVFRLADSNRMPRPVKVGCLVRWSRQTIDAWILAGCPASSEGQP